MRAAAYFWRASWARTWRTALTTTLIIGLLGAVALAALAGARRTASAYGRYLTSIDASDAFVNIPGRLPGMAVTRPMTLISRLPGVRSAAVYVGLDAAPVIHGKVHDSFLTNKVTGSYSGPSFGGEYFSQDRLTVLAGRLPRGGASGQIVLTSQLAAKIGARLGGHVTYQFSTAGNPFVPQARPVRRTFRVAAIVAVPPVLTDQADAINTALLPISATRQLLRFYEFAWVGVRLDHGAAGIPALQRSLTSLAGTLHRQITASGSSEPGLTLNIRDIRVIDTQVQQAIRPQAIALGIFGGIAAVAALVLAGQALTQLLSRSAAGLPVVRALGGSRLQAAAGASLPGVAAILAGAVLAVAGAIALSPLAPVGPIRHYDPDRGVSIDPLVLGAGAALLVFLLLAMLAVLAARAASQRGQSVRRPSALAKAAAAAGLPAPAVVGSRNALEPGSGAHAAPVRATLMGSVVAVTAVVMATTFGASLSGLISHPVRYGWNWNVLMQAEGGFGNFTPGALSKLIDGQPQVAGWSTLGFSPVPMGPHGTAVPVLGVQRQAGFVQPPTIGGHPVTGDGQVELGTITMRQLGVHIGQQVLAGTGRARQRLTVVGTVTLPSFGLSLADHVSLGRGAMMSERTLLAVLGLPPDAPESRSPPQAAPSAVAIDLAPGTTAAQRLALVDHISAANPDGTPGGTYQLLSYRAAEIENAAQMGSQPLSLALGLAVAAVLSLALTVLAVVVRRRRELAVLKAVGMTRRQVRSIVAWQTTLTLVIAMAAGIPLGIAAGRWAWRAFADSIGVAPVTEVPVLLLAAGALTLLVTGNLLTSAAGTVAARTPPAIALRAE